ncbi:MAG TPA: HdeA/HdeB family chaperone, partial [Propylenella sp.]|nr:HdeA/HdeB family chaperone [Propylenella sp.]
MKALMTSTAAAAFALSFAGSAEAQTGTAIGDTSLRPNDITCQDLMSASEEERTGLVYFIAGYHAAMRQGGFGGGSASATGSIGAGGASGASADAGGGASGGTTATTGGTDTAAAGTSGDAGGGASGGTTATTGGADTAA